MAKTAMKIKQQRKPKFSTREYSRCRICGRPHAYLRKYGICRICFRELAYNCLLYTSQKTFNIDTEIIVRESRQMKKGNVYFVEIKDADRIETVSYTHLDVYKRQSVQRRS